MLQAWEAKNHPSKPPMSGLISYMEPLGKEPSLDFLDLCSPGPSVPVLGARRGQPHSAQTAEGQVLGPVMATEQDQRDMWVC